MFKYKEIVGFIARYNNLPSFVECMENALGMFINRERIDVYEKILLYCPELNDKSKKYINDRIEQNKAMESKRKKLNAKHNAVLNSEEEAILLNGKLNDYLEDKPKLNEGAFVRATELAMNYGTGVIRTGIEAIEFPPNRDTLFNIDATAYNTWRGLYGTVRNDTLQVDIAGMDRTVNNPMPMNDEEQHYIDSLRGTNYTNRTVHFALRNNRYIEVDTRSRQIISRY